MSAKILEVKQASYTMDSKPIELSFSLQVLCRIIEVKIEAKIEANIVCVYQCIAKAFKGVQITILSDNQAGLRELSS